MSVISGAGEAGSRGGLDHSSQKSFSCLGFDLLSGLRHPPRHAPDDVIIHCGYDRLPPDGAVIGTFDSTIVVF